MNRRRTFLTKIFPNSPAPHAPFGKKKVKEVHMRCLFLKAKPELDFRYFSKAIALLREVNAAYQTKIGNRLFLVEVTCPVWWATSRFLKSVVYPM